MREQEVHSALLSGDPHDQLAIAYHLIVDNKRIADEAAKAELRGNPLVLAINWVESDSICIGMEDFYIAGSPPPAAFSPGDTSPIMMGGGMKPHPERIARKKFKEMSLYLLTYWDCSWERSDFPGAGS